MVPNNKKILFEIHREIPVVIIIKLMDHQHKKQKNDPQQIEKVQEKGSGQRSGDPQQDHSYYI